NPNRLTEVQVEMAWLADPATFPYRLTARVQGLTLRVSGCVPSSGVRSHVLQVARNHCGLPVRDDLTVVPGLAAYPQAVTATALEQAALAAVKSGFPPPAADVQVQVRGRSVLVVSGVVPSEEVSLAVCQRLRQLAGCSSVVNHLLVRRVVQPLVPRDVASAA